MLNTLRELEGWKISVIAMNGMAFDLSSPLGRMLATFLSGIAEFGRTSSVNAPNPALPLQRHGKNAWSSDRRSRLAPKVMALISEGRSYRWVARDLGISKNTVADIAKRYRDRQSITLNQS